ncbi:MAG: hypothetical protein PHW84_01890 [Methanosarcina sp.]|nr:hypothetical protein [Methanosarcina sp.]
MVLCSVTDVRSRIFTKLADADILDIIQDVSEEVLGLAESTDESNVYLILAGKNAAYAATLRRMRTTGEMAASKRQGNAQESNTIDTDIKYYDSEKERYIQKYKDANTDFSIPSGRMGYGVVDNELS